MSSDYLRQTIANFVHSDRSGYTMFYLSKRGRGSPYWRHHADVVDEILKEISLALRMKAVHLDGDKPKGRGARVLMPDAMAVAFLAAYLADETNAHAFETDRLVFENEVFDEEALEAGHRWHQKWLTKREAFLRKRRAKAKKTRSKSVITKLDSALDDL